MLDCSANCVTCNQMSGDVEVQMFQITGEMTRPLLHVVKTVDEALHLRVKESTFKPLSCWAASEQTGTLIWFLNRRTGIGLKDKIHPPSLTLSKIALMLSKLALWRQL